MTTRAERRHQTERMKAKALFRGRVVNGMDRRADERRLFSF